MPAARARTTTATYETQNVMCAIESWPIEPCASNSCRKNSSRLRPMTISGVTIGSRSRVSAPARPRPQPRQPEPEQRPEDHRHEHGDHRDLIVTASASSTSSLPNSAGTNRA